MTCSVLLTCSDDLFNVINVCYVLFVLFNTAVGLIKLGLIELSLIQIDIYCPH